MACAGSPKGTIKVHFEFYVKSVDCVGVTWTYLNVNATIKEVKLNLLELEGITTPGPLTLMFDGLLLEDEATLVGLGVVDEDTIYVSDSGVDRFRGVKMSSRIAEEISVGLNVLLGEAEHGFDVIHKDERNENCSLSIPGCCITCIYCIRQLYLFKDKFDKILLKRPHLVKNMPSFAEFIPHCDVLNHENCDNWEYYENCVFDCYEDKLDSFINNLQEQGVETQEYYDVLRELFPQDKTVKSNRKCPRDNHTNCTDPVGFYIGPARNSNFDNYLAYPPTIMMKVGKITDKTTLLDLLHSYQLYSEQIVLTLNLSYSNECFDLNSTVFDVIDSNAFMNNHYFSFSFDIAKSEDTRCIDDLVEYIEGEGDTVNERKKKKKKRKKSNNTVQNFTCTSISEGRQTSNIEMEEEKAKENQKISVRENCGIPHRNATKDIESLGAVAKTTKNKQIGVVLRNNKSFDRDRISNSEDVEIWQAAGDHLRERRMDLERQISVEKEHLLTHKQNVEDLIDKKAKEMKNIIILIDKSRDDKNKKMKGVIQVEQDMSALETKIKELNLRKRDLLDDCDREDDKIQKYESKRNRLEDYIENELRKNKEREVNIEARIEDLEIKLSGINNSANTFPNETLEGRVQPQEPLNKELLQFIDNQIIEKEKELECPVCLEVAESPIFMCSELHLICCNCRPKVKACPECRVEYVGKPKRHRYAEKTAEELVRIRIQRAQVTKQFST